MKPQGFHHIAMKVQDLDKTIAFYRAFGMTVERTWGEGSGRACLMHLGNGNYLELFANGEPGDKPEGFVAHFAIRVDNTQEAIDIAKKIGATVTKDVTHFVIPSSPENIPAILAFIKGPDGEIVEFFQTL